MQHLMQVQKSQLVFNILQIYNYKKLMQAIKITCRYGKNIVILWRNSEYGSKNQESRQICYEDKSYNHNNIDNMLFLLEKDHY